MTQPLRIVFAGTPSFAAAHLQALLDWPHGEIVAVYSQPDRPAGRGKKIAISPVKELALRHHVPVLQPQTLRSAEAQIELHALQPDIMVVVAYGLILPAAVLNTPRLGCINVHASILPRWRGAAPIQRAIEAGDRETGVTIMQMDEGLDTGAMLTIARCAIAPDETAGTLHEKLAQLGAPALLETLQQLATNRATPQRQDNSLSCYAAKITKEEAVLNWQRNAIELERQIRAFNPNPIAHGMLLGERIKIYRALAEHTTHTLPGVIIRAARDGIVVGCGENTSLRITDLQLAGGKPLSAGEVLNGRAELFKTGNCFDA